MVKVALKPLKGDKFEVEIDDGAKVQDMKKKIAELKPEFPAEQQKLIYLGKILEDSTPMQECNIKPDGFVVIMVAKAKAPAASSPTTEAPAPAAAAPTPAAAPAGGAPATDTDGPMSYEQAASNLVTGSGMESTVQQLCDMGFEREQVLRCLQAAFNNPDRAVEYLMSGIPEGLTAPAGGEGAAPPPGAAPPAAAPGGAAPFPGGTTGGGGGSAAALQELRNHPRFAELAQMVTQNPQMLAQILPALAQSNPGLMQAVQENPEAFMRLVQEAAGGAQRPPQDPVAAMLAAAQAGGGTAGQMPPGAGPGPGAGQTVIRLNDDERAAVERLAALGFDRNAAVQAYLACDKNEELAANFLFDSGGMDTD